MPDLMASNRLMINFCVREFAICRKYTVFIMTAAIFSILIINFIITIYWFQRQQFNSFNNKINQVIHTMENNQEELDAIKNNLSSEELNRLCANPELFYAKIQTITETPTENGGYLGVITDVTGDVLEKQRIQYENNHDQLTGLLRYRYFKKQIPEILKNGKKTGTCACVMMDLDNFKSINDTYGHDVGDKYLIAFAVKLTEDAERRISASGGVAFAEGTEIDLILLLGRQTRLYIRRNAKIKEHMWNMFSAERRNEVPPLQLIRKKSSLSFQLFHTAMHYAMVAL